MDIQDPKGVQGAVGMLGSVSTLVPLDILCYVSIQDLAFILSTIRYDEFC